jgi:hypothetical protein
MGKWKEQLDIFPREKLPEPSRGDVVTVELTSAGELKRYRNGNLLHTVATNKTLEDGEWYGAFEAAMNVASVTLLEVDPYLDSAQHLGEKLVEFVDADCKQLQNGLINNIEVLFEMLLSDSLNNIQPQRQISCM